MIYKTLTRNEVEDLNNELKNRLPGTAKVSLFSSFTTEQLTGCHDNPTYRLVFINEYVQN